MQKIFSGFFVIILITLLSVTESYSQDTTQVAAPVQEVAPAPEPAPEPTPEPEVAPAEEMVQEMEAPAPASKGIRVGGGLGLSLSSTVENADEADNGMSMGGGVEISLSKYIPNLKNASLLIGFGVVTKKVSYKTNKDKESNHTDISAHLKYGLPANLPNNIKAYAAVGGILSGTDNEKTSDKVLQFGAGIDYPVNAKLSATVTALYSMGLDNQLWLYGGDGTRSGLGLAVGVLYAL